MASLIIGAITTAAAALSSSPAAASVLAKGIVSLLHPLPPALPLFLQTLLQQLGVFLT